MELLDATGLHLADYCEQARTGALTIGVRTPGKALAMATTARKYAVLSSFYSFAWRCGALSRHLDVAPEGRTLRRDERRLLRRGVSQLADSGRIIQAVAVALLEATGATVEELAALTDHNLHAVGDGAANLPVLITVRGHQGDVVTFPIPAAVRTWLTALISHRRAGDPLLESEAGRRVDCEWLGRALIDAAIAGGIPRSRAELLRPDMLYANSCADYGRSAPATCPHAHPQGPHPDHH
ncbi:hypothetical protein [Nonomuraea sp. NPDC049400]|uniref:hypothetical protein n=1 Tax=Nonomuraea sp. NPDC049400 TaxID=3364352 RepID=UPI0037918DC8